MKVVPVTMMALGAMALLTRSAFAQGGPPLITDDPGTPGDRRWEINTAFTLERTPDGRTFESPLLDINYGVGEQVQLKYEAAFLVLDEQGGGPSGTLSNSLVGIKWRFLDQDRQGVSMSVYPQVEFNNPGLNAAGRGLVDDGTQVLIPFEIARTFGKFKVGVEIGYNFVQYEDDEWKYGVAAAYPVTDRLEVLGEIAGVVDRGFHRNAPVFNLGFRYQLTGQVNLLFSAGRSLRSSLSEDEPGLLVYTGVQFNL